MKFNLNTYANKADYQLSSSLNNQLNDINTEVPVDPLLKFISKDTESLRMTGMKHSEIRQCMVDKYMSGDINGSQQTLDTINLVLGKED